MIVNSIKSLSICAIFFISMLDIKSQTDFYICTDSVNNIIPVFTTTVDLLDNELQSQDISGLLQSSETFMLIRLVLILVQLDID